MSFDRIEGATREGMGHVQDGVGGLVGDRAIQAKGMLDEALGSAQDAYGQVKDGAQTALNQVAHRARSVSGDLQDFVNEQPALATIIALSESDGLMLGVLQLGGGRAIYDRR